MTIKETPILTNNFRTASGDSGVFNERGDGSQRGQAGSSVRNKQEGSGRVRSEVAHVRQAGYRGRKTGRQARL